MEIYVNKIIMITDIFLFLKEKLNLNEIEKERNISIRKIKDKK
jgi:hypothetical protein